MMNFVIISLVIFACLASTQAKVYNLAELQKTVLANDDALPKVLNLYEDNGYSTMKTIIEEELSLGSRRKRVENFPTNLHVTLLNRDQHELYNVMAQHALLYPLMINASHLSDALKTGALAVAVIKTITNPLSNPTPAEIVGKVMETVYHEMGVLNKGRLEKPKRKLESLYAELAEIITDYEEIASVKFWIFTSRAVETFQENCSDNWHAKCDNQMKTAIKKLAKVDQRMRDNTPINSKQKVQNLSPILSEYFVAMAELHKILQAKDLMCYYDIVGCR